MVGRKLDSLEQQDTLFTSQNFLKWAVDNYLKSFEYAEKKRNCDRKSIEDKRSDAYTQTYLKPAYLNVCNISTSQLCQTTKKELLVGSLSTAALSVSSGMFSFIL